MSPLARFYLSYASLEAFGLVSLTCHWRVLTSTEKLDPFPPPVALSDLFSRAVEPITGGTFTGPAFNATVDGGIAYPSTFANGTVREPFITIWGTTTGNASFLVQLSGTGVPRRQFARAVSSIRSLLS